MHNLSYGNEFYLHVNENLFSYERLCTKKEVQDNLEMAHFQGVLSDDRHNSPFHSYLFSFALKCF